MTEPAFSPDIQELLSVLYNHDVEYLLVGGQAVIRHGYPRATGDVDLFYLQTPDNCARLWAALTAYWGPVVPSLDSVGDLLEPGVMVLFGRPPNRVDLLSTLGTVPFEAAWSRRLAEVATWRGKPFTIWIVGREDLLQAKRDAGRPKDLADLAFLEALGEE